MNVQFVTFILQTMKIQQSWSKGPTRRLSLCLEFERFTLVFIWVVMFWCVQNLYVWFWLLFERFAFVFGFGLVIPVTFSYLLFVSVTLVTINRTRTGSICTSDLYGSCNPPMNRTDSKESRTNTVPKNHITRMMFLS